MAVKTKSQEDLFLDSMLADYKKPEDFLGENGILKQLTKKLIERALQTEMTTHHGSWEQRKRDPCRQQHAQWV